VLVEFRSSDYGQTVQSILALGGDGLRAMPLAPGGPSSPEAEQRLQKLSANELFAGALSPNGAMSGLFLYFSCLNESHVLAQELSTPDGSFWHGIMHRQEPDPENAAYWFRRVGEHRVFPALAGAAKKLGYSTGNKWDPFGFIEYCEAARRKPGSSEEQLAMQVQLVEWQLLFDYCARPGRTNS
jgi:hypothetical protein